MCKVGQKITRKVDGIMKFFTNMFNPVFNYPPKTLSIAEPTPLKTGGSKGSKTEPKRQPLTKVEPKAGSTLEVVKQPQATASAVKQPASAVKQPASTVEPQQTAAKEPEKIVCPVEVKVENLEVKNLEIKNIATESVQKTIEASFKAGKEKTDKKDIERNDKMSERKKHHDDEYCHDDHDKYYCPPFPEVPIVLKGFEWCDYYYYKDDICKFEDYIKEYKCKYPCVLIKYKKVYPTKCKVHIYVYFSLCEYEKAWEIEEKLQKKYREMKMHDHHDKHKY